MQITIKIKKQQSYRHEILGNKILMQTMDIEIVKKYQILGALLSNYSI